jgi:hypothetical protein
MPGPGSMKMVSGGVLNAAVHGSFVRLTHDMCPAGHLGVEKLKRGGRKTDPG